MSKYILLFIRLVQQLLSILQIIMLFILPQSRLLIRLKIKEQRERQGVEVKAEDPAVASLPVPASLSVGVVPKPIGYPAADPPVPIPF